MKLKLALAVTFSVGLVVILWILIGGDPGNGGEAPIGPAEEPLPGAAPIAAIEPLTAPPTIERDDARETVTERQPATPPRATVLGPWEGQLAGIVGRVVDAEGTPQPRLRVDLLQADWTLLVADDLRDLGRGVSLGLGHAVTDAEGRFQIDGAWSAAFHGLGVDLGGQRATLRVIDHALEHGEVTDLGDIVLAPSGVLIGKVVDEAGRPVSGARVRVGAVPEELLGARIYDLRADSKLAITELAAAAQPGGLIELPGWLRKHLDSLPVPTTTSGADGVFRLEGVPLTRVLGGIDLPGFVGIPVGPLEAKEGEQDLGLLTLTRGRTLRGLVLDAAGQPVPGFEVHAGAEVPLGDVALLQPCGKSDAEGRFTSTGVPREGRLVAIARRAEGEPYAAAVAEDGGPLVIRLPFAADLDVRVVDAEGSPLRGARLQLTPLGTGGSSIGRTALAILAQRTPALVDGFREIEVGLYRRARVSFGNYELRARVAGRTTTHARIEVGEATGVFTLTCGAGIRLALTVIDETSGEPVPGARATIMRTGMPLVSTLALGWSDARGEVQLGPFELVPEEVAAEGPMGSRPPILVVEHPGYAGHDEVLQPSGAATVVRLQAGGALHGLIHWGGAVPERLYMIILEYRDADGLAELVHVPKLGLSGPTGEFRFGNLRAGEYRIEIFERFLDGDIVGLARDQQEPVRVHRENLEVTPGSTTELQIDLSPSGQGPTGRIVGSLRIDGAPLEGAHVRIERSRDMSIRTDAWGRFDSGDIPVQRSSNVTITADLSHYPGGQSEQPIHDERIGLEAGDVHRIDLNLSPRILNVEVVDASSEVPLEGVTVFVRRQENGRGRRTRGETDRVGSVQLLLLHEGPHAVEAHRAGYVVQHAQTDSEPVAGEEALKIELVSAAPCAGRIEISSFEHDPGNPLWLHVTREGGGDAWEHMRAGQLEFSFDNLGAGTYRAQLYTQGGQSEEITFELGEQGDRNLLLRF